MSEVVFGLVLIESLLLSLCKCHALAAMVFLVFILVCYCIALPRFTRALTLMKEFYFGMK